MDIVLALCPSIWLSSVYQIHLKFHEIVKTDETSCASAHERGFADDFSSLALFRLAQWKNTYSRVYFGAAPCDKWRKISGGGAISRKRCVRVQCFQFRRNSQKRLRRNFSQCCNYFPSFFVSLVLFYLFIFFFA